MRHDISPTIKATSTFLRKNASIKVWETWGLENPNGLQPSERAGKSISKQPSTVKKVLADFAAFD